MNRKILIIITTIILILISILVFIFFKNKKTDVIDNEDLIQQNLINERISDKNIFVEAEANNNYLDCELIADSYFKDLCFNNISVENSDSSGCSYIENIKTKNICYFTIQKNKAIKEKNINPCKELEDDSAINACIEQVEASNFCGEEGCSE